MPMSRMAQPNVVMFHNYRHSLQVETLLRRARYNHIQPIIWGKPNALRFGQAGSWAPAFEMATFAVHGELKRCVIAPKNTPTSSQSPPIVFTTSIPRLMG